MKFTTTIAIKRKNNWLSLSFLTALIFSGYTMRAQTISLTTLGTAYPQDFNTLSNVAGSTTNNLTIPGWFLTEGGGGARDNEQYATDAGGSTTGDMYSYGAVAATDRALGQLRSGTLIPLFGAAFTNNTGAAISSLTVSYTGEEWRLGTAGRTDQMNFEYSTNATDLVTGTWTNVSSLNFVTPNTVTAGAKDGNLAANRTLLSSSVTGLNIPNGATFWIRWTDVDASGADDGLAVDDFFLTPFATSLSATTIQTNLVCNGVCNGSATVTPANGTAPYTYSWAPAGGTDSTASSLCAGTYTATITDATSASITKIITITQPSAVSGSTTVTNVSCFGGSNGAIDLSSSGGTPGYTFNWGGGVTTEDLTGLNVGSYSVTITDANGCTGTASATVTQPAAITASLGTITNVSCNGGANGSASVTAAGGTGTLSYDWTGTPSGDGTNTITGLAAGTYTVTVSDQNSCMATATATITEPPALTASSSATTILCNGGTADITVSATGGTGAYSGTGTFTVGAGTYSYTVTDANGCASTTNITVAEPPVLTAASSATTVLCNGGTADITVSATGGTGAYSGTGTFTVGAGTYSYTVTDANGCVSTTNITVAEPPALTASSSATAILCNGGTADITVSATGGTGAYSGTGTFTVGAGTYSYTVTDANGCSSTTNITVAEPTALMVMSSATSILCNGGTADITVNAMDGTGPYSGTGTFTVGAGTYSYTVTDDNGCTASTNISVSEPSALMVMSSATSILCNGGTADITVSAMDGTGPYSGTGTFTVSAGTYSYTVTDDNGCTASTNVTVADPAAITSFTSSTNSNCGGTTGTATVTASGGTGTLTYLWSSAGTAATEINLAAGTYTVTITDDNGCTATNTVNVSDIGAPTVTTASTDASCNGSSNGAIDNTVTGGTGAYIYTWSNLETTEDITGLAAGTYNYTVEDAAGCQATGSVTIAEPAAIDVSLTVTGTTITANNAIATAYQWLDCNNANAVINGENGQSFTALNNGDYSVAITLNGCVDTSACENIMSIGINTIDANGALNIYPNPTSGMFNIVANNAGFKELTISIVDVQGKEVYSSTDKNTGNVFNKQINLEGLAKGIYYLKMNSGTDLQIRKLIID